MEAARHMRYSIAARKKGLGLKQHACPNTHAQNEELFLSASDARSIIVLVPPRHHCPRCLATELDASIPILPFLSVFLARCAVPCRTLSHMDTHALEVGSIATTCSIRTGLATTADHHTQVPHHCKQVLRTGSTTVSSSETHKRFGHGCLNSHFPLLFKQQSREFC